MQTFQKSTPLKMVLIEVNASAKKDTHMGLTNKEPNPARVMSAVTDAELHRYNTASTELLESQLPIWAKKLSTPNDPVSTYFIDVAFEGIEEPELAQLLNAIPTSFKLSNDQVDGLTRAGRQLLRGSPEFQQLLSDSGGKLVSGTEDATGN